MTTIEKFAFYNCNKLTSIIIPDEVTSIGELAFYKCSRLTSITIPDGVTNIGESAFDGCSGLTSITIPDGVTNIENYAFQNCSGLTSVTISSSVTSIGSSTFSDCIGLTAITVDSSNANYKDIDGVLFSKDEKKLIRYPASKKDTSYEIPSSVTKLASFAFSGCTNLTSITVPESVTDFGTDAFEGCDANLDSLYKRIIYGSGSWKLGLSDIGECALAEYSWSVSWIIIVFSSDTSFESNYGYIGGLRDEHGYSGFNGKFSIKENKLSITLDDQTEPYVTYSVSISNNRLKFSNDKNDEYGVYLFKRYDGSIPPAGWEKDYADYND